MSTKKTADLVDDLLSRLDDLKPEDIERLSKASAEKFKGIEEAKRKEALAAVKAEIAQYHFTARELGFTGSAEPVANKAKLLGEKRRLKKGETPTRFVAWKYYDPATESHWSGKGHTKPEWLRDLSDKQLEKFAISFDHPINRKRYEEWRQDFAKAYGSFPDPHEDGGLPLE